MTGPLMNGAPATGGRIRDSLLLTSPGPVSIGAGAVAFAAMLGLHAFAGRLDWARELTHGPVLVLGLFIAIMVERLVRLSAAHVQMRDRLEDSNRRFEDVLATSSDWVWETDTRGRFVFLSDSVSEKLQRPLDDLIGRTRRSLAATTADRETIEAMNAAMAAREPFRNIIYGAHLPDGSLRYLRVSGRPRFASDGTFQGYLGTGSDVTEETAAATRLQVAEARLSLALESMAEGIALFDVNGRLTLHNGRLRRLLRGTSATLSEEPTLEDLLLSATSDAGQVRAFLSRRFANQLKPLTLRTPDGRWLTCRMAPARDNGTLTLWADITKEVEAREEADRLELQRRHAQKLEAIGTLAGGIAHEINTPIQYVGDNLAFLRTAFDDILAVLNAAAPLRDTSADLDRAWTDADVDFLREDVPQALDQSRDGIQTVARIVLAMKEFAHPSAKEPVPFDINHVLDSTATVCRNEWKHVAALDYDLAADLPTVVGLPGEINQVLLNLIVNAAHAITAAERVEGHITLATRVRDDHVEVVIADNGTGIPDSIRDRIFDPFFTTKPVGQGTGQGLAIAHDIVVRKHGGSISVDSTPGEGTTFILRLPCGDDATHRDAA